MTCWGANGTGQLGRSGNGLVPGDVSGLHKDVVGISLGNLHSCALLSNGNVKCWGSNASGQLGNGSTRHRNTPVNVSGLGKGVTAIAAGADHSCALSTSGGVKCWGSNVSGQLGNGGTAQRSKPVNVSGLTRGVAAISTGAQHSCAVTTGGAVKCWGSNTRGQLGNSGTALRRKPVSVSGLAEGVAAVTTGAEHSCALTTAGGVKCWGSNAHGQLGIGSTVDQRTPVEVDGLSEGVWAIRAGSHHTCALMQTGGMYCWGRNSHGQSGTRGVADNLTPVWLGRWGWDSVVVISAGAEHSCALDAGGNARCWGANLYGRLGDGSMVDRYSPGPVTGSTRYINISAGGAHTCGLTMGGTVKCWGWNEYGQLGDGSNTIRLLPVDVSGLSGASAEAAGMY